MSTILLPIKPEYVSKILNQTKLYEYRKNKCKKKVDKIIIYSTSPVKKVVAEVSVLDLLCGTPAEIWEKTSMHSGAEKESFMRYFQNKEKAYAYQLGKINVYHRPKELTDFGIDYYPQSHVYIDDEK